MSIYDEERGIWIRDPDDESMMAVNVMGQFESRAVMDGDWKNAFYFGVNAYRTLYVMESRKGRG